MDAAVVKDKDTLIIGVWFQFWKLKDLSTNMREQKKTDHLFCNKVIEIHGIQWVAIYPFFEIAATREYHSPHTKLSIKSACSPTIASPYHHAIEWSFLVASSKNTNSSPSPQKLSGSWTVALHSALSSSSCSHAILCNSFRVRPAWRRFPCNAETEMTMSW